MLAVRNVLKLWLIVLVLCGVLGASGYALGGLRLATVFAFSALLVVLGVYWSADRVVVGMVGARELLPAEAPSLHSALERLAARAQVVKPKLYLIADPFPRALAAGRGPGSGSAVIVSSGLVGAATPAELSGVLAHEIAHLRHRDVLVQATAVLIASALVESSRIGGFLQRSLLFVLGPVAAAFTHLLLSPKREYAADRFAADLCESPHGLADALTRFEQARELVGLEGSPATEPLYTANPFPEDGLAALFATHPPVSERIRRLRRLDPDWKQKLAAA